MLHLGAEGAGEVSHRQGGADYRRPPESPDGGQARADGAGPQVSGQENIPTSPRHPRGHRPQLRVPVPGGATLQPVLHDGGRPHHDLPRGREASHSAHRGEET